MGQFLQDEKIEQVHFKINSVYFSNPVKRTAFTKENPIPFACPSNMPVKTCVFRNPAACY